MSLLKICDRCGGAYRVKNSIAEKSKYCSLECQHPLVERECKVCKTKFRVKPSRVKKGKGVYCSIECYKKDHEIDREQVKNLLSQGNSPKKVAELVGCFVDTIYRIIKECGIKHKKVLSEEHKRKLSPLGRKHSEETKAKMRVAQLEDKGHNWNGGPTRRRTGSYWVAQRAKALNRDNYKCQHCGSVEKLTVHHKVPFRHFKNYKDAHALENLISLCLVCHGIEESKKTMRGCKIGANPTIWYYVNLYECEIGNNVKIGSHTEIGPAKIGDNVTISAQCFIPKNTTIMDNCWIGPGVRICNDRFPPSGEEHWEFTYIHSGARIGESVTILPGVYIGENALVGAGAVVTKNIPAGETWAGVPAKKL